MLSIIPLPPSCQPFCVIQVAPFYSSFRLPLSMPAPGQRVCVCAGRAPGLKGKTSVCVTACSIKASGRSSPSSSFLLLNCYSSFANWRLSWINLSFQEGIICWLKGIIKTCPGPGSYWACWEFPLCLDNFCPWAHNSRRLRRADLGDIHPHTWPKYRSKRVSGVSCNSRRMLQEAFVFPLCY